MPGLPGAKAGNVSTSQTYRRIMPVKKIALTLVAVATLGLAACGTDNNTNEATDANVEATANETLTDLDNAQVAADNALDALSNTAENAGEAVENVVEAAGEATENAAH